MSVIRNLTGLVVSKHASDRFQERVLIFENREFADRLLIEYIKKSESASKSYKNDNDYIYRIKDAVRFDALVRFPVDEPPIVVTIFNISTFKPRKVRTGFNKPNCRRSKHIQKWANDVF